MVNGPRRVDDTERIDLLIVRLGATWSGYWSNSPNACQQRSQTERPESKVHDAPVVNALYPYRYKRLPWSRQVSEGVTRGVLHKAPDKRGVGPGAQVLSRPDHPGRNRFEQGFGMPRLEDVMPAAVATKHAIAKALLTPCDKCRSAR